MAQQIARKAKRAAAKPATKPRKARTGEAGAATAAKARAKTTRDDETLAEECERLRNELAAARARIKALEEQRKNLADRIDWVVDSLHTLLDE